MKREWIRAIENVEHFAKLAGLIEVPPKMLQEGIAWAKSVYCREVKQKLNKERFAGEEREKIKQMIDRMAKSPIFEVIRNAEGREGAEQIFQALEGNRDVHISHFDPEANDPQTDQLLGLYDWVRHPAALNLAVRHLSDGDVNFFLDISISHAGFPVSIQEKGISQEGAIDYIRKYLHIIATIVDKFTDFARGYEVFSKNDKQQLGHVDAECRKHIKEQFSNPYPIKVVLDDSRYLTQYTGVKDIPANVVCRFLFSDYARKNIYSGSEWKGLWHGMIYLYKDEKKIDGTSLLRLRDELNDIEETMRHEMQHMMQDHLALIRAIPNGPDGYYGLPGKKYRIPGYNQSGYSLSQPKDEGERLEHDLRDVEFYTELSDNLAAYKRIVPKIPLKLRSTFFKTWVGQMPIAPFISALAVNLSQISGNKSIDLYRFNAERDALQKAQAFFGQFNAIPKYDKAIKVLYSELLKVGLV